MTLTPDVSGPSSAARHPILGLASKSLDHAEPSIWNASSLAEGTGKAMQEAVCNKQISYSVVMNGANGSLRR